jgi:hypothetical protein
MLNKNYLKTKFVIDCECHLERLLSGDLKVTSEARDTAHK